MEKNEKKEKAERKHPFTDNAAEGRYELDVDGDKAFVEYIKRPDVIILTHTYVPERHEGRGIGSELVLAALEDIREQQLRLVPQCEFVARYIYRHPEWEEIVYKQEPAL